MSALPPKADILEHDCHVRFVPTADIGSKTLRAGFSFPRYSQTVQAGVQLPDGWGAVRPASAGRRRRATIG